MSYDICLLVISEGETLSDAAKRDEAENEPYTEPARERNARIVSAIRARYPAFEVSESDQHMELTDVEGGSGMQLSLFASSGAITLPYWRENEARHVQRKLSDVLRLVLENSEFVAFDPQTERELTVHSGLDAAASTFAIGVAATRRASKRPWWRFW